MTGYTCETEEIQRIFVGFAVEAQKKIPESFQRKKKKVIILAGPTASGKSSFGLSLAREIGGEIVSGDSMQVYKGMDIGTAKPTKEDCVEIPHHLIDIRDVTEPFNVVDFYYEARQACQNILNRGSVPIVVGGSGFYLHSLIYGPPSGPPSIPEVRKTLEDEIEKEGAENLFKRLEEIDPIYAKTITKNDKQKIVRALEIFTITGKKVSNLSWVSRRRPQNYDFRCWFLYRPKAELYKRIEQRCDEMIRQGFLEEVKHLIQHGLLSNPSALQAIGYRQALQFFNSKMTDDDYCKFVEAFKKASKHYAKRQFTWFKREPLFDKDTRWIDLDLHDSEVAREKVIKDYELL